MSIGFLVTNALNAQSWNTNGNNINTSNWFGSINNVQILTRTNNTNRMKLNGNLSYAIDGYNGNRNGNLLLGWQNTGTLYNPNRGAYSLLHLNGEGTTLQEGGYRSWMKTGITFTGNNDLSYIGLRQVGTGTDITETTIAWSDNQGASHPGPDDMVFRFLASGGGTTAISSNLQSVNDYDGLHVARFTSTGNFGLGNTFGTNPTGTPSNLYVRPASLGHYSLSDLRSVWQQFTNRNTANGSGTGETASDGLRIGIVGNANANANGTAALYNQEARALLFSTSANTNSINLTSGTTLERMRIMSVGTPTHLATGGFGVYNPGNITSNRTRVAISHNPSQPITRPLSLLHLGYNTGLNSFPAGSMECLYLL
ncbi:MAG TPA: hypothetical protein VNJ50_13770 [Gelidibacter sp.]|uniref:hypothetical protein n=1 Tax=Gelidibacter sp. TaxID=2018083 RepID=UPI002CE2D0FF|nr:hypothetical protein [Gelidibacter sp.]HXJ99916.1 hypothetical protein [Gelidibacter sp.]